MRCGIIGYPLGHSVSPAMHVAAFTAFGIDGSYELWETPADALAARVEALRDPAVGGANVTIPHKQAVLPLLDVLDPLAGAIGAVNTIVNRDGRLTGYNTDAPGFLRSLAEEGGFEPRGARVLVLGAGGAARGIVHALATAGAECITIANRTLAKGDSLAVAVETATGVPVDACCEPGDLGDYACIVNTTSLGMLGAQQAQLPCALDSAATGTLVADIVYNPSQTAWMAEAERRGLPVVGGLGMLVHQGALAFELWTGQAPPPGVMFAAAAEALGQGKP